MLAPVPAATDIGTLAGRGSVLLRAVLAAAMPGPTVNAYRATNNMRVDFFYTLPLPSRELATQLPRTPH